MKTKLFKIAAPILSVVAFIALWQLGATYLYSIEAERKIENARVTGGEQQAEMERQCIENKEKGCQPVTLPSPSDVLDAAVILWDDIVRINKEKKEFYEKVSSLNEKLEAQGKETIVYTGRASFADQILTSLKTVLWGVILAFLLAVPTGILMGLFKGLRTSTNWLIQIFKPVSPVVWLLLVSMVVKTVMANSDGDQAFIISFISVGLCAMWATLVNTSMGVSTVNPDYINVAKVLRLSIGKKIIKVVLPASFPLIFTGVRITVSVAWMVLIAIELLAQSPGLGSFVWEEFQNGATESNAKIIVAMFVIGIIGFLLDRIMLAVQKAIEEGKVGKVVMITLLKVTGKAAA